MLKMKNRIVPAILAAMALTALTACGGDKAADTTTAAEATTEAQAEESKEEKADESKEENADESKEESKEETTEEAKADASGDSSDYLAQVDTMNKAAEEFITVSMEFMQLAQDDPENIEAMTECIEKTRATKQAFVDFSQISNPPEGLEEPHAKLAEAAGKYADTLEVYCDVLLASINGEDHEAAATIQDDWTKVATELSEAMGAVEEAASN